jgi:hypothetical protein
MANNYKGQFLSNFGAYTDENLMCFPFFITLQASRPVLSAIKLLFHGYQ